MNRTEYIRSRFEKVLLENINEKADEILNKLNLDKEVPFDPPGGPTDYVQEGEMCEQCGSEMTEGECSECGNMYEGDIQELGGMDSEHPRFGKLNLKNMSKDELEDLLNVDHDDESDEDDEWEEIDLDTETDWEKLEEGEEELDEKLYGKQHKLDKNKNGKLDADDFKRLRDMKEEDEPLYEVEFEREVDESETEEGNAFTGALADAKKKGEKDFEVDGKKYEVREKWEGDVEVKQTGEYSDMSIEELNAAIKKLKDKNKKAEESGKKVSKADRTKMGQLYFAKRAKQGWKGKGKAKVNESLIFTENELISLIEKMVNEEKNSFKMKEPKGYREYEKAHNKDKKENEDYLKSVAKKMTDYLKGASDNGSKYEMKETQKFPTENGGLKKGNRKKYTPSDAVDEYIDAFSYPGQTNLVYDEIKPNDERIEKYLKGHSTTGNAQVDKDGNALGNVVPSEVGEKFFKNYKDNLYGQEQQDASYKRQPQPVDQAGEQTERGSLKSKRGKKTSQSVLNKLEETTNEKKITKLNEEFDRIQNLMGYNRKTQ
jgi:hypothetical protein